MKIFYHFDDDGRCAAAIVYREFRNVFDQMSDDDFIKYGHSGHIDPVEFRKNESVYIVDLALDDTIYNSVIVPAVKAGSKVIHIDHHKTTLDNLDGVDSDIMSKITTFYKIGLSGTLLTWIFALMKDDERNAPDKVDFDFTDHKTHVAFNPLTKNMREYKIPDVIRFINDNDVWTHEIDESKYFNIGFKLEEDKHPTAKIWDNLIYSSTSREVFKIVNDGKLIWDYQNLQNKRTLKNAFTSDVFGVQCFCVNGYGNSRVFGDMINEFPMVCIFHYAGYVGMWHYSLYSHADGEDVSEIAKRYGGCGHRHAAAFISQRLLFE